MFNSSTIISHILFVVSLTLVTGVFVHDTKLDKATTTALSVPAMTASYDHSEKSFKLGGEAHTHVERVSVAGNEMRNGMPRIQPRDDSRRYQLQKKVSRGVHAFDGYYYAFN